MLVVAVDPVAPIEAGPRRGLRRFPGAELLAPALCGATGDGAADRVVLNATNGNHATRVSGDAGAVKVSGLSATVDVLHPELANDRLEINTLGGGNKVDAGGLAAGAIQLLVNGVSLP